MPSCGPGCMPTSPRTVTDLHYVTERFEGDRDWLAHNECCPRYQRKWPQRCDLWAIFMPVGYVFGHVSSVWVNCSSPSWPISSRLTSVDHAFMAIPAQAYVATMLQTFADFPPRQKSASFNLDHEITKLQETAKSD
jgi:hypothetical protein